MDFMVLQIAAIAATTVVVVSSLRFVSRYLETRRQPRSATTIVAGLQERLERIEQVVETTALEVERISEANRFLAKLLAERKAGPVPRVGSPERVITPV